MLATLAAPTAAAPSPRREKLTERHRPSRLAEVVGQGYLTAHLAAFVDEPMSSSFLFEGSTGTGKSSMARALAGDLGCDLSEPELGGFSRIAAGEQAADHVREVARNLWARPMMSARGWKVLVVEEADRMSEAVAVLWLGILEDLPPRTVIAFTTNHVGKFPERFLDRSELFTFEDDGEALAADAQGLIDSIWAKETGEMRGPRLGDLPGVINEDGTISFRRAVAALEPLLRRNAPRPMPRAAGSTGPDVVSIATPAPKRTRARADAEVMGDSDLAPVAIPAVPDAPGGEDAASLRAWVDRIDEAYEALGLECIRVGALRKVAEARLKAARKTK